MVNFRVSQPKIFDGNTDLSRYETAKVYGSDDEESLGSNIVVGGERNSDEEDEEGSEVASIASSMSPSCDVSTNSARDSDYEADCDDDEDESSDESDSSERPRKRARTGDSTEPAQTANPGRATAEQRVAKRKRKTTKTEILDSESELTELESASPSSPARKQRRVSYHNRQHAAVEHTDSRSIPQLPPHSPSQASDPNDADDSDSCGLSSPPSNLPLVPRLPPTRIPAAPVECTCTEWCTCTKHAYAADGNRPTPKHLGEWALVDMASNYRVSSARDEPVPMMRTMQQASRSRADGEQGPREG